MDLDLAYANGAFIPGAEDYAPRWAARGGGVSRGAGAPRAGGSGLWAGGRGTGSICSCPRTRRAGVVIFVHGGYWMTFGRESWSHLAAGPLARGWAVAMPSYTLAPEARISADDTRDRDGAGGDRPAGRRADGGDGPFRGRASERADGLQGRGAAAGDRRAVVRAVPISPLADLAPLRQTKMNETLQLDAAEAKAESPISHARREACGVTVWVGGQERPAFLWQARTLSEDWACPWSVAPGKHHFDVIDDLADPRSTLVSTVVGGL